MKHSEMEFSPRANEFLRALVRQVQDELENFARKSEWQPFEGYDIWDREDFKEVFARQFAWRLTDLDSEEN